MRFILKRIRAPLLALTAAGILTLLAGLGALRSLDWAARAAMDMVDGAETLSRELLSQYGRTISFGVGIHVGPAVVGNYVKAAPIRTADIQTK